MRNTVSRGIRIKTGTNEKLQAIANHCGTTPNAVISALIEDAYIDVAFAKHNIEELPVSEEKSMFPISNFIYWIKGMFRKRQAA